MNDFKVVYNELNDNEKAQVYLHNMEKELAQYIEQENFEPDNKLHLWFEGKLDKSFYYSYKNEELFIDYLLEEFSKLREENILDKKIDLAKKSVKSHDAKDNSVDLLR